VLVDVVMDGEWVMSTARINQAIKTRRLSLQRTLLWLVDAVQLKYWITTRDWSTRGKYVVRNNYFRPLFRFVLEVVF
jgi:hypothetical protein